MKKLLCCLLSIAMIMSMAMFSACSLIGDTIHLRYGEKYIISWLVGEEGERENHLIFYRNGTGIFRRFEEATISGDDYCYSYTTSFKYEIVDDDSIVCFYDSVEYDDVNTNGAVKSDWMEIFACSKNVIKCASGGIYVAESYLGELPDFNKSN